VTSDPLIDEDGRCRRTELLPSECGCAAHRGGEALPTEGVLVSRFLIAKYDGRCALTPSHRIQAGSEIGMAVQEDDIYSEVGWVCEQCVRTITA
jgi:hypothetical protein